MSLPLLLPYGVVSIYGKGFSTYVAGMIQEGGSLYGLVDAVAQHEIYNAVIGKTVYFKEAEIITRINFPAENTPFTLIYDAKIIGTVEIPP